MPYYNFDSTALVKRYSMERGTRVVNKLMVKRGKVAILPMWSVTDFYSALSIRSQQGEITRDDRSRHDAYRSSQRRVRERLFGKEFGTEVENRGNSA